MAYLKVVSHFWSGIFLDGQVSAPCVPIRFCEDIPFDWFDDLLLDFFIDSNVYYQNESDILVQLGSPFVSPLVLPDSTPECGLDGFLDADCWRSLGFDQDSFWEPDKQEQLELYVDPENNFIDPEIRGVCCVELWRCTGDLDFSPIDGSPDLVCDDPQKLTFIQYLPNDLGPVGFSNPDPHEAFDAQFERLMFCGACGEEDGLLEVIPDSL